MEDNEGHCELVGPALPCRLLSEARSRQHPAARSCRMLTSSPVRFVDPMTEEATNWLPCARLNQRLLTPLRLASILPRTHLLLPLQNHSPRLVREWVPPPSEDLEMRQAVCADHA